MCSNSVLAYAGNQAKLARNQVILRHPLLNTLSAMKMSDSGKGVLRHWNCAKLLVFIVSVFRQLSYGGVSLSCRKLSVSCRKLSINIAVQL